MKRLLLVLFLLGFAATASAEYTTATIASVEGNVVRVDFTGPGVTKVTINYTVSGTTTGPTLRNWRDERILELNNVSSFISSSKLTEGAVIPAGPGATALTAKQIWQGKASRLVLLQNIKAAAVANTGSLNATFTSELNALAVDVATSYQAGFGN